MSGQRYAPELILSCGEAFLELRDFALRLAQILEHVGAEILIDLDNLQLDLTDLAARTGGVGDELTALPLQPRLVALELGIARHGNELLLVEFSDSNKLLPD